MRGADCGTDHVMLKTRLKVCRRKQHCRRGGNPPRKLDTCVLKRTKEAGRTHTENGRKLERLGEQQLRERHSREMGNAEGYGVSDCE